MALEIMKFINDSKMALRNHENHVFQVKNVVTSFWSKRSHFKSNLKSFSSLPSEISTVGREIDRAMDFAYISSAIALLMLAFQHVHCSPREQLPNIIVILMDDQDSVLGGMVHLIALG